MTMPELNKDEQALLLDALAALPLARSYNLFNKLIQAFNSPPTPPAQPVQDLLPPVAKD